MRKGETMVRSTVKTKSDGRRTGLAARLLVGVMAALCAILALGTVAHAQTVAPEWHDFSELGTTNLEATPVKFTEGVNAYICSPQADARDVDLNLQEGDFTCSGDAECRNLYASDGHLIRSKRVILKKASGRASSGSMTALYRDAGYMTDGTVFDLVVKAEFESLAPLQYDSYIWDAENLFAACTDHGASTSEYSGQGFRVVLTLNLYKRGTYDMATGQGEALDTPPVFTLVAQDLDVADGSVLTNGGDYGGDYSEGLEFIDNCGQTVHLVNPLTAAQGHSSGSAGAENENGKKLTVGTKNGNTWIHASHGCATYADSSLAIKLYDGAKFAWTGSYPYTDPNGNWVNTYTGWENNEPRTVQLNGMGTYLNFQAAAEDYPEMDDPAKAPETQSKSLGDTVTWSISQTFPYVYEVKPTDWQTGVVSTERSNAPQSIAFSDVLDAAFDASTATVAVKKGGTDGTDVTSQWTKTTSGQTIKMETTDTAHTPADNKESVEGPYTFVISAKLKEGYDLSSYESQDGKKKVPNTATITVVPKVGDDITKTTNKVNVLVGSAPELTVTKTASPTSIASPTADSSKVTWTVNVSNSGDSTISGIALTDALLTERNVAITLDKTTLAPGETATGSAEMAVTQGDINAGSVKNTVKATGTDGVSGDTVESNEADATVTLERKALLTIEKQASPSTVAVGGTVTYQIIVQNKGNVPLSPVTITDEKLGIHDLEISSVLVPGATATKDGLTYGPVTEADAIAGKIENTASAHGVPPTGVDQPADPTDTATVNVTHTQVITLSKTTPSPTLPATTKAGDRVTWNFEVENTGDVTLSNVSVTDPLLAERNITVTLAKTTLAPGEKTTATVSMALTQADINAGRVTNTAKAKGTPSTSTTPVESPEDSATVEIQRGAALDIKKVAKADEAHIGDTVEFDLTVTNTGNVSLSNVTITDELTGDAAVKVADALAPGETATKTVKYGPVTEADAKAKTIKNVASAHGEPPEGVTPPEDPTDDATVTVVARPSLAIEKSVSPEEVKDAKPGDEVEWAMTVTNDGDITVTDVAITDQMLVDRGIKLELDKTTLAPGETTSVKAKMALTQDDIDAGSVKNVAIATGEDPIGGDAGDDGAAKRIESPEADATAKVEQKPDMKVEKSVDPSQASVGQTVKWKVTATNTGNVTLKDVTVDDELLGVKGQVIAGVLAPGKSASVVFDYEVTEADGKEGGRKNIAVVRAVWGIGDSETIERKAEASISVPKAPAATVAKKTTSKAADLVQTGSAFALVTAGAIAAAGAAMGVARRRRKDA